MTHLTDRQLVRDPAEGDPLQVPAARARPLGRGLEDGRRRTGSRPCSRAGNRRCTDLPPARDPRMRIPLGGTSRVSAREHVRTGDSVLARRAIVGLVRQLITRHRRLAPRPARRLVRGTSAESGNRLVTRRSSRRPCRTSHRASGCASGCEAAGRAGRGRGAPSAPSARRERQMLRRLTRADADPGGRSRKIATALWACSTPDTSAHRAAPSARRAATRIS